jgi:hypothetical protein
MFEWDLTAIRAKVRSLTGRKVEAQLSTAALDGYINQFYQNELPRLLQHTQFEDWFDFDTADGDGGEYTIDALETNDGANILEIDFSYVTIDDAIATVYTDRALFFSAWPEGITYDEDQPDSILIEGRSIWLRPPPDGVYNVKFKVRRKIPAALVNATDKPLDASWGPCLAYGASMTIKDDSDQDSSKDQNKLDYYLTLANRDTVFRKSNQQAARSF